MSGELKTALLRRRVAAKRGWLANFVPDVGGKGGYRARKPKLVPLWRGMEGRGAENSPPKTAVFCHLSQVQRLMRLKRPGVRGWVVVEDQLLSAQFSQVQRLFAVKLQLCILN